MLTYKNLLNAEHGCLEFGCKYFAVAVRLPDLEKPEIIINPKDNLPEKIKYYLKNYDDELKLIHNPAIQIVGITFGNSFEEIEEDLLG